MPKNEEGEFELILGNRQLISVFLIIVVLLGVFFSMGYIVGRNSAPAETARAEKPSADTPAASSSSDASTSSPPAIDTPSDTTPPSITQPEKPPAPAPKVEEKKEKKEKRSPAPPSEDAAPAKVSGQVASGEYWQVVATARPDAEIIAETLGKKGFHAILSPAPKDGVFRVLVGPFSDAPSQAQARTNLESAGFKNPILRKY